MSSRKFRSNEGGESPPTGEAQPPMGFEDLFAPPQPGEQLAPRVPRPPPLRPLPPRWRRNALAVAIVLGVGAGVFLMLAPARGWVNWGWLQRLTHPSDDQAEVSGTGGSPLPETRSALPTPPTAPIPEAAAPTEVEPERALEDTPRSPAAKARGVSRIGKVKRYAERRRARRGPVKLRPDQATEVLLY